MVDVVTTLPNQCLSVSADRPSVEQDGASTVRRIVRPEHWRGMFDQARALVACVRGARVFTRHHPNTISCSRDHIRGEMAADIQRFGMGG